MDTNSNPAVVGRRTFVAASAASTAVAVLPEVGRGAVRARLRAGVIGHTGRGNYGHGLERVWADVPAAQLVALADADREGREKMSAQLSVPGFASYYEMLDKVKPDLVAVAPRWLDQHCEMVVACAKAGVKGIYLEKPMCRDLTEADKMVAACEANGVKLAMATQTRYCPQVDMIQRMIQDDMLGEIVEFRVRGKDDRRGGGEDLWVLGTHVLDLMSHFGGDAKSCYARVYQHGELARGRDVVQGAEGIGPLTGDEIHAMYRLSHGATGYFDSKKNAMGSPSRFGIRIFGTKGVVELYDTGSLPTTRYLPASAWSTGRSGKSWLAITSNGIDKPETLPNGGLHQGNVLAVKDLIASLNQSRQPRANLYEARKTVEMIAGVFESHRLGRAVDLPLQQRANPLSLLKSSG